MGETGPRLSDGIVVLRPWLPEDAPAIFSACQDPEIGRWTNVPQPYLPEHAEGFIAHSIQAWREGTAARFAITDAATGAMLGSITREPMTGHIAEFGYWLAPQARGRGAATRALRLIADWTLATTNAIRLESYTDAGNDRSGAVLLRAGFQREGLRRAWDLDRSGNPIDSIFYVRLRGDLDLRPVSHADLPFLAEMTLLAAFPPGQLPQGAASMPRVVRWTDGWGRAGDAGVVAWRDGRRIGAAWCRIQDEPLAPNEDAALPEIAIAVVPNERSRGVGERLLAALADKCDQALSLTVNAQNPARRLYERLGFAEVRREGDCLTMVLRNPGGRSPSPAHSVPILEFDPSTPAVIEPSLAIKRKDIPENFVLCFFHEAIDRLVADLGGREVARLVCEMGPTPVFEITAGERRVGLALAGVGAPLAAGWLEELIAFGACRFIVAGGAGALVPGLALGHVLVPTAAIRDEGTSFHYAPASRTIAPTDDALAAVLATLERRGVPYRTGLTWTTDAFYRETRGKVEARVAEGAISVEMEAAALFAVARFRGVSLAQMLYAGDDLSGEAWDHRGWPAHASGRDLLLRLAIEAALAMDKSASAI
jgi:uridine phosphorylase